MNPFALASMPLVTAFIGWLTNWVAIQMLFRPRKPFSLLGWKLQGLIPKNQDRFAQQIGGIVERELINRHSIKEQLEKVDFGPHLDELVHRLVHEHLAKQLASIPLVGAMLGGGLLDKFEAMAKDALHKESGPFIHKLAEQAEEHLQVSSVVAAKIRSYDLGKLEGLIREVSNRELKRIEYLGGVLGFLVGLGQVALLVLTQ